MASKPEAIRVSARYLTDSGRKAGKCKKDAGRDAGKLVSPPYPIRKKKWTQDHKILTTGFGGGGKPGRLKVQLMIQRIPDITGKMCTVLWDTGAQISPVTHLCVKEAGF
jgi:hypothetical protein